MICPHCNKEVDSYTCINAQDINLSLNNGCAGVVPNYIYTVSNAGVANPPTAIGLGNGILNVAGCANQGGLNAHYHVI